MISTRSHTKVSHFWTCKFRKKHFFIRNSTLTERFRGVPTVGRLNSQWHKKSWGEVPVGGQAPVAPNANQMPPSSTSSNWHFPQPALPPTGTLRLKFPNCRNTGCRRLKCEIFTAPQNVFKNFLINDAQAWLSLTFRIPLVCPITQNEFHY